VPELDPEPLPLPEAGFFFLPSLVEDPPPLPLSDESEDLVRPDCEFNALTAICIVA
jgi:hypothetical protein